MANYHTKASFVIDCTEAQADTAISALRHINDEISDHALATLKADDGGEFSEEQLIIRHCLLNNPGVDDSNTEDIADRDDLYWGLYWGFSIKKCKQGLVIYSEENMNTEEAAVFTQAVLVAFDLPQLVQIKAAHGADRTIVDAFGGHACVVAKDFIRRNGMEDFLLAEEVAHGNSERYFICGFTEVDGENEYPKDFLMKCVGDTDPEDQLDNYFVGFNGDGAKDEDGYVEFEDGRGAKDLCMNEITPLEFSIMQRYMRVI